MVSRSSLICMQQQGTESKGWHQEGWTPQASAAVQERLRWLLKADEVKGDVSVSMLGGAQLSSCSSMAQAAADLGSATPARSSSSARLLGGMRLTGSASWMLLLAGKPAAHSQQARPPSRRSTHRIQGACNALHDFGGGSGCAVAAAAEGRAQVVPHRSALQPGGQRDAPERMSVPALHHQSHFAMAYAHPILCARRTQRCAGLQIAAAAGSEAGALLVALPRHLT